VAVEREALGGAAGCASIAQQAGQMFHVHPRFRSDGMEVVYTESVPDTAGLHLDVPSSAPCRAVRGK
jgi:hypothetical protein